MDVSLVTHSCSGHRDGIRDKLGKVMSIAIKSGGLPSLCTVDMVVLRRNANSRTATPDEYFIVQFLSLWAILRLWSVGADVAVGSGLPGLSILQFHKVQVLRWRAALVLRLCPRELLQWVSGCLLKWRKEKNGLYIRINSMIYCYCLR